MPLIPLTANVTDHSTQNGYQFEFHCDRCRNGVMSSFVANKAGMAGGLLRAASSFFGGGLLGEAATASDYLRDSTRGQARDDAIARAVAEARPWFRQCGRCHLWVCPDRCFNPARGLCTTCGPDLAVETAAAQASAARDQVWDKARTTDQLPNLDLSPTAHHTAACGHCGAVAGPGKFCQECGQPLAVERRCAACGAAVAGKFCTECGARAV